MLPNTSVPSTDDVETAFTLVQIGDTITPYMQETAVHETPLFEGPEVSNSDDAMDKIVGRLDVSSWKPLNCTDAMDQVITLVVSQNVNVETKNTLKPKLIVNVEQKGARLNWSEWIPFCLIMSLIKVLVYLKKIKPVQRTLAQNPQLAPDYVQETKIKGQQDIQGVPAKMYSILRNLRKTCQ